MAENTENSAVQMYNTTVKPSDESQTMWQPSNYVIAVHPYVMIVKPRDEVNASASSKTMWQQ